MLFLPHGTGEQLAWYDEAQRRSTSAENAVRLYEARNRIDVLDAAARVTTPTLVLHARDDRVVPVEEGRLLAARIPGARFVLLDSSNHILLPTSRRGGSSGPRSTRSWARRGRPAPTGGRRRSARAS